MRNTTEKMKEKTWHYKMLAYSNFLLPLSSSNWQLRVDSYYYLHEKIAEKYIWTRVYAIRITNLLCQLMMTQVCITYVLKQSEMTLGKDFVLKG